MPFSDPIVAGDTLVIPAIQSDGYVTGASGWRIQRDGTAEFNNVTVRGVLEVTNAFGSVSVGKFLVGGAPAFRSSETSTGYNVDIYAGTLLLGKLGGGPADALLQYNEQTGSPAFDIVTLSLNPTNGPTVLLNLQEKQTDTTKSEITVNQPIKVMTESWNALAGLNSWVSNGVSPPQYRMMPDGTVMLRGMFINGTTAAGTNFATLPAGYRPQYESRFITAEASSGTVFRHVNIQTDGRMLVFNATTASLCIDGIRFALPVLEA